MVMATIIMVTIITTTAIIIAMEEDLVDWDSDSGSVYWVMVWAIMGAAPLIHLRIAIRRQDMRRIMDMHRLSPFLPLRLSISSSRGSCKCRHKLKVPITGTIAEIRKATIPM